VRKCRSGNLPPAHRPIGWIGWGWDRAALAQPLMRAALIIEDRVCDQDSPQVVLVEDQQVIQALAAGAAYLTLGVAVGPRPCRHGTVSAALPADEPAGFTVTISRTQLPGGR
jgi:hypothetical protein